MLQVSPTLLAIAALLVTCGGVWAIQQARIEDDPGWVVVDEFAGQWITLLGIGQAAPLQLLAAFTVFRIMDIAKPGPVGWADRQPGALGIMADDVIAGLIGAVLLYALRPLWPVNSW